MVTEARDRRTNLDDNSRNDGVKRMPHERDESPDGSDTAPRGVMKQAADDLAQGLVDTDLHGVRGAETTVPSGPSAGQPGHGQARPRPDASNGMRHSSTSKDKP